ncbi:hypothetical protein Tco_1433317 [Tanacetum coccineum]
MRAEYNIMERRRLKSVVEEKDTLLKAKDKEIGSLKAQLLLKEAEAAKAIRLCAEASKFEAVDRSLKGEVEALRECNTALEKENNELNVKVVDIAASVKIREQEVANFDAVVTSVKSQNDNLMNQVHEWLLTHGMELAVTKCLNSPEYLSAIRAAISKAIEKGMQDGLTAGITHGAEGRNLNDVAAHNPSVEVDYITALQRLQSVNFSLIADLRSNKDASVETIMNLLHLEDTLTEKLGLTESQPHVEQLIVPIHHSLDQHVIGASALSLSLDVSSSRVRKIKENIANQRSALRDVFVPLSEPLSATALTGTEGTSGVKPATADTTTTMSIVIASTSTVRPISIDDYEVVGTDDQAAADRNVADEDVNPFPNVDDAELNVLK